MAEKYTTLDRSRVQVLFLIRAPARAVAQAHLLQEEDLDNSEIIHIFAPIMVIAGPAGSCN